MMLRVRPGDKATIKSTEKCIISKTKKARQVKSNVETMLICFLNIKGLVHFEFVPQGQTVNQQFYLEVLKRLCGAVRRKRPKLWWSGEWLLHHDNAPAHKALSVRQFLTKHGMTTASQPPHSPDLAPCGFFSCFQERRGTLKESIFRM